MVDAPPGLLYVIVAQEWQGTPAHLDLEEPSRCLIIDGFGAHLSPPQIRARMQEYTALAESAEVAIWLVTINRTALDEMWREGGDRVYLPMADGGLMPLETAFDPNWLYHFTLGDLYDRGKLDESQWRPQQSQKP